MRIRGEEKINYAYKDILGRWLKITDKNAKIGDITIDHTVDVKLLKSLLNLEKDKIVLGKEREGEGLIDEFLSDFIYLPDVLLYHDQLVLPRPKEYYVKEIGEKLLDSDAINKLQKNKIIYFPPEEVYDFKAAEELHRKLIHDISKDPRPNLIAFIESPYNERPSRWLKEHGFLDKNTTLKPYYAGGADEIVRWLNTIDLDQIYASIPANATDDPIIAERDLIGSPGYSVFLTSNIPVMEAGYFIQDFIFFDAFVKEKWKLETTKTTTTLSLVLNELSKIRGEEYKELIENGIITQSQVYEIPFTFGLLINEMPKKSQPSDLIDIIIKKRNEKGIKKFRRWLKESDIERGKDYAHIDYGKIMKIHADIELVAENLRSEFSSMSLTKKILQHSPHFITKIIGIVISGGAALIEKIPDIIDSVDFLYPKMRSSHIAYMQKLGKAGIKVSKQLEDIFGEQGREFSSILRYYSAVDEKTDRILKMKKTKLKETISIHVGEVYMGDVFKNIRNATIINKSIIVNSFNKIKEGYGEDIARALLQIAEFIEKSKNREAGELFDSFNEELNKPQPKKSVLKSLWGGIEKALPAITTLSAAITKLASLFES